MPHHRAARRSILYVSIVAVALFTASASARPCVAQTPPGATIRGIVVDARDLTPLEKVSVRVQDTKVMTVTGSDGRFELAGVPAGRQELYVSSVDYVLVRRVVEVAPGDILDITIPISAGTGIYTETIHVNSAVEEDTTPSQQVLRSNELQQLRGVITNDPMRAIHVLPGVATGDDLRSEFSVRGLPVRNMNFTFEGISTPLLVHTVQGVQDNGSIAMVNGDVLTEIGLAAGSYAQRHGNHTGAELNFLMREGSRDRVHGVVRPSMTDTSVVLEGPTGQSKTGSWLVSIRKSYLGTVIRRIDPDNSFAFGFHDSQVKLVQDVGSAHQVQFAFTAGRSRLDQAPEFIGVANVQDGVNDAAVAVVTWRYVASPRLVLTQRLAAARNNFRNRNVNGLQLARGARSETMYRADWTYARSARVLFDGGGELRRAVQSRFEQGLEILAPAFAVRESFSASAHTASSYVMAKIIRGRSAIAPGMRLDHSTLTGDTSVSPWLQTQWPLSASLLMRAGAGIYRQEPEMVEVKGLRGADLKAARSYHADVSVEGPLTASVAWQIAAYNREDRDYPAVPDADFRATGGRLFLRSLTSQYQNALDGYSRGIGFLVRRRSPNGLSGWVAYDLTKTIYRLSFDDPSVVSTFVNSSGRGQSIVRTLAPEAFYGDYDQRHTLNAYAVYRLSDRTSFSSRFRAGSNFPVPGYYVAGTAPASRDRPDGQYFLGGETRNTVRVPAYTRLDVRANRTFTWRTTRLTLFAEVLNLYNRRNVRAAAPGINSNTFEVFGLLDPMFPVIPSLGFSLEF